MSDNQKLVWQTIPLADLVGIQNYEFNVFCNEPLPIVVQRLLDFEKRMISEFGAIPGTVSMRGFLHNECVSFKRLETTKEARKRTKAAETRARNKKARIAKKEREELAQYEKLKQKFENK